MPATARTWRVAGALAAVLALAAALPSAASADRAVALLPGNALLTFSTEAPSTTTFVPITGLALGHTLTGIDMRPFDGQLYGVAVTTASVANSVITTYRIDPATGAATSIGATAAALAGATVTTLFAIDRNDNALARIGSVDAMPDSPNLGGVTQIGPLNVLLAPAADGGFDITAAGTAFAALATVGDSVTRLYTVNLATGAALGLGQIGAGGPVRDLAILPPLPVTPPPPPPPPVAPPPPDRTAPIPLVIVPSSTRLTSTAIGRIAIDFSCSEACAATATLRVGTVTIGRATATLARADVGHLRLKTTASQRSAITKLRRSRKNRRAVLTLRFADAAGNAKQLTRRITLRR